MGYVFISYSTKNQPTADALKALFNDNDIETWMAPGDIPVGSKYAAVINRAVKECSCFVLLLSNDAQDSSWVPKEVERAIDYKRPMISVKIEDVVLNDEFKLYLSTDQLIAIQKLDEEAEETKLLLKSVKSIVNISNKGDSEKTDELTDSETEGEDEQYFSFLRSILGTTGELNCPDCESGKMKQENKEREGFSVVKAGLGAFFAGPIGLAAGLLGHKKITYKCDNCGYTLERNTLI